MYKSNFKSNFNCLLSDLEYVHILCVSFQPRISSLYFYSKHKQIGLSSLNQYITVSSHFSWYENLFQMHKVQHQSV